MESSSFLVSRSSRILASAMLSEESHDEQITEVQVYRSVGSYGHVPSGCTSDWSTNQFTEVHTAALGRTTRLTGGRVRHCLRLIIALEWAQSACFSRSKALQSLPKLY